ncbi:MAG TPA: hypothetical protein DEQ09_12070 [Bacteroidales bacterium]|nr:hypothetical protein [Bacteroidales bacterium]
MKNILLPALIFLFCSLSAQKDPVATAILDKFSEKSLSAPSVSMKFNLRIHDKIEDSMQESEGQLVIKNNRYKLELPDNIIWFDGQSTWNLSPEVKEVTVSLPDPDENTFMTNPTSLFDIYKQDFKYRLLEKSEKASVIDLYPENPSNTEFSLIRLVIDEQNSLVSALYRRKDGIDLYIDVNKYSLKNDYPSEYFKFDPAKYPDVDIIDMR